MHFAAAVATFETQLKANQRSRHTVSSYLRDLGMLQRWLEREEQPPVVERLTPTVLLQRRGPPRGVTGLGIVSHLESGMLSQVESGYCEPPGVGSC